MKTKVIVFMLISVFVHSCVYAVRHDETYKGRVVDEETGRPIEGAVVLGTWYVVYSGAPGSYHEFYDARETVTDKDGYFRIDGQGIRIMSNLEPMHILIFKAGYDYLDVPWVTLKKDKMIRDKIKWDDGAAIIPLRKLSMEERRTRIISRPNIPHDKMKMLTKEINEERTIKGLSPLEEIK